MSEVLRSASDGPLDGDAFDAFFEAVHGVIPFPWQSRLARQVLADGFWPDQLDLPTATGKTAALDIALFHLAAEAHLGSRRRAPVRIAFVVDRRLIVDDAYARAGKIAHALLRADPEPAIARVRDALLPLAETPIRKEEAVRPLLVGRLRGGVPREDDWARTPTQPTIITSTVDQVGSRLLFRGYGVKPRMAPIHAGLLGVDCLLLLDEAHLSGPFEHTLRSVERLGQSEAGVTRRHLQSAVMTATPTGRAQRPFGLDQADFADPILHARLTRPKPTVLGLIKSTKGGEDDEPVLAAGRAAEMARRRSTERERTDAIVEHVDLALAHLRRQEAKLAGAQPVVGVVVNRVLRARAVYERLVERHRAAHQEGGPEPHRGITLVIGPARGVDRERLADNDLAPLKTDQKDARQALTGPQIVVATQTIEAGVDLDFDALITESAPLDAIRQRFGRLNRAGRDIVPYAAVVAHARDDLKLKGDGDPLYGFAAMETWRRFEQWNEDGGLDLAHSAMEPRLASLSEDQLGKLLTPRSRAPVLMPAYVDLWSQTSPIPATDPDEALFLHGPSRNAPRARLVWRADLTRDTMASAEGVLDAAPPKAGEAVEVSLSAARAWLAGLAARPSERTGMVDFADAPQGEAEEARLPPNGWPVFRVGKRKEVVSNPAALQPNDLVVVPANYGGCDHFGWRPDDTTPVVDVGERAAWPYRRRRYAARLTRARLEAALSAMDADGGEPANDAGGRWTTLAARLGELSDDPEDQLEAVLSAGLPPRLEALFRPLRHARRARRGRRLEVLTPYSAQDDEDPYAAGIVIVARLGLAAGAELVGDEEGSIGDGQEDVLASGDPATEDDEIGSMDRRDLDLRTHSSDVEKQTESFARVCGLSDAMAADMALAGWLHDAGKADPRFQALLGTGDPLALEDRAILGKSARRSSPGAWVRAGLPEGWRHEALSVRLALGNPKLKEANDAALVIWLVGAHHGLGRPFFPNTDPRDAAGHPELPVIEGLSGPLGAGLGPQSPGFSLENEAFKTSACLDGDTSEDLRGLGWVQLFELLKRRYGVWGLAHLETILRLADHRASERRDAALDDGERK